MSYSKQAVEKFITDTVRGAYDIIVTSHVEVNGVTQVKAQYKAHSQQGYFLIELQIAADGTVTKVG